MNTKKNYLMDTFIFRASPVIKVYSFDVHYSSSYLLNILLKKKNQKQLLKELQTDLLASKYINEATSITGFLTEYVFSSIATEAKLQKLTGWEKKERRFKESESK